MDEQPQLLQQQPQGGSPPPASPPPDYPPPVGGDFSTISLGAVSLVVVITTVILPSIPSNPRSFSRDGFPCVTLSRADARFMATGVINVFEFVLQIDLGYARFQLCMPQTVLTNAPQMHRSLIESIPYEDDQRISRWGNVGDGRRFWLSFLWHCVLVEWIILYHGHGLVMRRWFNRNEIHRSHIIQQFCLFSSLLFHSSSLLYLSFSWDR